MPLSRREAKAANKVRARLGLPPRTNNSSSTTRHALYGEAVTFPSSPSAPAPKSPEAPPTDPRRRAPWAMAAMGNQAVQGAAESSLTTPPSTAVEVTVAMTAREHEKALAQKYRERADRQMRLREVLEPGLFALTHKKEPDGFHIWAVAIVNGYEETEDVTDRFAPQTYPDGSVESAEITHHNQDGTWSHFPVRGMKVALAPGRPDRIIFEVQDRRGIPQDVTMDELFASTDMHNLGDYWDLRPPIPFVEMSRAVDEQPRLLPPVQPSHPTA